MTAIDTLSGIDVEAAKQARMERPEALASLVELDPDQPVVDQARLVDSGVAVWAIVNHIGNVIDGEIEDDVEATTVAQTAHDYQISAVEVVAAFDFYRRHRAEIDAWRKRTMALHETMAARGRPVTA